MAYINGKPNFIVVTGKDIPTQEKAVEITQNGATEVTPDSGFALSKVNVNVNVPDTPTQEKTVEITENGTTDVTPDEGYALRKVSVNVNVAASGGGEENDLDKLAGGTITEATLPTANSVKKWLFAECKNLISVSAPKATSLGTNVFYNCINLETINLPEVKTLADASSQFMYCKKLKEVYLPKVLTVGSYSFSGCTSLEIVRLPKGNRLMDNAFADCSSLQLLDLANPSVGSNSGISYSSFSFCSALKALVLRATNGFYSLSSSALSSTQIQKGGGFIYVQRSYIDDYASLTNWSAHASALRAIEDYTVDGTVTGELDLAKMGIEVTE